MEDTHFRKLLVQDRARFQLYITKKKKKKRAGKKSGVRDMELREFAVGKKKKKI